MNTQIQTFLSLLYPCPSRWIALCLIPAATHDVERTEHRFTRVDQLARFLAYARFRNAHGWGIYLTPSVLQRGARNRRKSSFHDEQQIVYLDCDRRSCLESIRSRFVSPTLVVRTSPGRHQVYWRLQQAVSIAQQERLMRAMAQDIGADSAATDVSRVLRLPSFWNRKPGRSNTVDLVFRRDHAVPYEFRHALHSSHRRLPQRLVVSRSRAHAGELSVCLKRGLARGHRLRMERRQVREIGMKCIVVWRWGAEWTS